MESPGDIGSFGPWCDAVRSLDVVFRRVLQIPCRRAVDNQLGNQNGDHPRIVALGQKVLVGVFVRVLRGRPFAGSLETGRKPEFVDPIGAHFGGVIQ